MFNVLFAHQEDIHNRQELLDYGRYPYNNLKTQGGSDEES